MRRFPGLSSGERPRERKKRRVEVSGRAPALSSRRDPRNPLATGRRERPTGACSSGARRPRRAGPRSAAGLDDDHGVGERHENAVSGQEGRSGEPSCARKARSWRPGLAPSARRAPRVRAESTAGAPWPRRPRCVRSRRAHLGGRRRRCRGPPRDDHRPLPMRGRRRVASRSARPRVWRLRDPTMATVTRGLRGASADRDAGGGVSEPAEAGRVEGIEGSEMDEVATSPHRPTRPSGCAPPLGARLSAPNPAASPYLFFE